MSCVYWRAEAIVNEMGACCGEMCWAVQLYTQVSLAQDRCIEKLTHKRRVRQMVRNEMVRGLCIIRLKVK